MNFDLGELIRVIAENCPNEAVGLFIGTYGVFIVGLLLLAVVLIREIKKTSVKGVKTDNEINETKKAVEILASQMAKIAVDNANVSNDIKEEIKENNDTTMQLLIAMALSSGMNYTDILNTIKKATNIYNASAQQYQALQEEVQAKIEEEQQAQAEAEQAKAKANEDLASIKIGI